MPQRGGPFTRTGSIFVGSLSSPPLSRRFLAHDGHHVLALRKPIGGKMATPERFVSWVSEHPILCIHRVVGEARGGRKGRIGVAYFVLTPPSSFRVTKALIRRRVHAEPIAVACWDPWSRVGGVRRVVRRRVRVSVSWVRLGRKIRRRARKAATITKATGGLQGVADEGGRWRQPPRCSSRGTAAPGTAAATGIAASAAATTAALQ